MIEFKIKVKDEDKFNMYLRSLDNGRYLKEYVKFEDAEKESFGIDNSKNSFRMMSFVAIPKYDTKYFYYHVTLMFRELKDILDMDIEFRYVPNKSALYDADPNMGSIPYCKLV